MNDLVVVLMIVVGLIGVIVFVLFVRKSLIAARGDNLGLPTCSSCGYIVRGVESFSCPECGKDLREVGIVIPGSLQHASGVGCLFPVGFSIAVLLAAWLMFSAFETIIPRFAIQHVGIELTSSSGQHDAAIGLDYVQDINSASASAMPFGHSTSAFWTPQQPLVHTLQLPAPNP